MQVAPAEFDAVTAARALREADCSYQAYDFEKVRSGVDGLPPRWRSNILRRLIGGLVDGEARYRARRDALVYRHDLYELRQREWSELHAGDARHAAWEGYRAVLARLRHAVLPLDADDQHVTLEADRLAIEAAQVIAGSRSFGDRLAALQRFCTQHGVEPAHVKKNTWKGKARRCETDSASALVQHPSGEYAANICGESDPMMAERPGESGISPDSPSLSAIKRMTCPQWWRRRLRASYARTVEASAIELGFVSLRADRYVSDESLARRGQQNRRNQRTLERTIAENEDGQRYTLAELAATGIANKSIRRGELITRLKGFEVIADELGHAAVFVTLTAPSRFHARTRDGAANSKHDGSTPRQTADYLAGVWSRIRAKLGRCKLAVYGFRIAEPHGDGTPHQHFILFCEPARIDELQAIVREHALRDTPDEPGAAQHRAKFEKIDKARGSAVGYVIKYVAKAIDGFRVGDWKVDGDLIGDETLNLSPRIEAWAATWGIRQFQQIGGPPVGLWREMRRIPRAAVAEASDVMRDAWLAAQRLFDKRVVSEDGEVLTVKLADFGDFTRAAGGPLMPRIKRPLQLVKREQEGLGRYGEPLPPKPAGVSHRGVVWKFLGGIADLSGPQPCGVRGFVESVRRAWRIVSARLGFGVPRTRVNNCTVDNFRSVDKSVDKSAARSGMSSGTGPPASEPVPTAAP